MLRYPFRLLPLVAATFPKGTAFGGGDKVFGIAIRRPLGGTGERSEPEGVLGLADEGFFQHPLHPLAENCSHPGKISIICMHSGS